ncbi:PREDICTED: breast cancer anti-estrogen resistance protein 1-like isoform X1 [Branchiostoma belcheri]|uniref:Breast cancer anti-estrogen resistance protein 1 n=1 Tax=Branchiostoma belcheri TaxID=7741 RepID=A0A6P4YYL6_BRABE|nr:PREDICTED: breast cancer anti-estrogen resistance protein 1-like isoform X1 [Branchiostoma belcheri]
MGAFRASLNVLAKALYDNIPETPDELGFRKGDIVTVLEQNTQGLEGWWLCSLHGRQGIAPGNRMKLLAGMYDKPFSPTPQQQPQQPLYQTPAKAAGYQVPPSHQYQSPPSHQPLYKVPSSGGSYSTPSPFSPYSTPSPHAVYNVPTSHGGFASTYQVPPSSAGYQVPPAAPGYGYPGQQTSPGYQVLPGAVREQNYQVPPSLQRQRNSATNINTNKVVTPRRVGQVYHYESPTKLEQETYDTPPQRSQQAALHGRQHSGGPQEFYDTLPKRDDGPRKQRPDIYDSPSKMSKPPSETYDSPRSNRSSMEILDTYDTPKSNRSSMEILDVYDIPKSDKLAFEPAEVYDVPKSTLGGSELGMTYDTPPRLKRTQRLPSDLEYDVPDSPKKKSMDPEEVYDKPPPPKEAYPQDVYDIPMNNAPAEIYDVPSKDAGIKVMAVPPQKAGHTEDDYDDYVYDVPPQVSRDQPNGTTFTSSRRSLDEVDSGFNRLSVSTTSSTSSESLTMIPPGKELNLDLHAAMDLLGKLQSEVDYAVSRLLSFVNKDWRKKESMEKNGAEVKTNCLKVKTALGEFIEFAHGAIANSMKAADRSLHKKLSRHLMPLQDTHDALVKTSKALEANEWSMDCMVKNQITTVPDDLDQFVSASRGVPEDVKQLASFIHGNSLLLFKRGKTVAEMAKSAQQQQGSPPLSPDADKPALKPKPVWLKRDSTDGETSPPIANPSRESSKKEVQSRPLPAPPQEKSSDNDSCIADTELEEENLYENDSKDWMEDYDYVHLQEKEAFERQQRKLLEQQRVEKENMEKDQVHQFEKLEQEVSRPVESHMNNWTPPANLGPTHLCRTDKELLVFYSQQMNSHVTTLLNAIDAFFTCVERSESPKIFVAHSKFVILAAHKLVFVGDTLFRSIEHNDIRNKIMHCSNLLCDTLKMVVGATKTAALQYPSVAALQDMVDRVTEISHASQQLNITVGQAATL